MSKTNIKKLIFNLGLIVLINFNFINLINCDVILIQNTKQTTASTAASTAPEQNYTINESGTESPALPTIDSNKTDTGGGDDITTKSPTTSGILLDSLSTKPLTRVNESDSNSTTVSSGGSTVTTINIPIETSSGDNSEKGNTGETTVVVIQNSAKSTTVSADDLLIPPANVTPNIVHKDLPSDDKKITVIKTGDCPSLENADSLSQTQLIERLTHGCRYDRLERPITYMGSGENRTRLPVNVYARAYIYFMQNLEAHDLQFKIHALLQLRYVDPRLAFSDIAPSRNQPIMGEDSLRQAIWIPHIFFSNERDSSILGTDQKDILTSIKGDGTVILSTRIQATLYCWMNLRKFPFDEQHCATNLESWMYNTTELELHWEKKSPITLAPELHLTEYILLDMFHNETTIVADLSDLRHGAFAGNYSSLSFTVHLAREMGFYLMDYFLPSMMIVAISWVSFWLQADQSAPRIMLGTSTMLTFITLASAQGKTLPKVSYIKVSEVWFLGCTFFIVGSLLEFAFVNTIWRRQKSIELKKVNAKYVLKSTLTPRLARKEVLGMQKSQSCTSLNETKDESNYKTTSALNSLTVHGYQNLPRPNNVPVILTESVDEDMNTMDNGHHIGISMEPLSNSKQKILSKSSLNSTGDGNNNNKTFAGWTTMTPQQVSKWIDQRARFWFPASFLVFNLLFWTFVYVL